MSLRFSALLMMKNERRLHGIAFTGRAKQAVGSVCCDFHGQEAVICVQD